MRLSPDGSTAPQRHHRVHVGTDARAGCRFTARHAQAVDGPDAFPLAEPVEESVVTAIEQQIADVGPSRPRKLSALPGHPLPVRRHGQPLHHDSGYQPPTGSLSTTAALALCVFVAVPFGIEDQGLRGYLRSYVTPTFIMLPFRRHREVSRTLALAVRLFGNMMAAMISVRDLLTITPFLFRSS